MAERPVLWRLAPVDLLDWIFLSVPGSAGSGWQRGLTVDKMCPPGPVWVSAPPPPITSPSPVTGSLPRLRPPVCLSSWEASGWKDCLYGPSLTHCTLCLWEGQGLLPLLSVSPFSPSLSLLQSLPAAPRTSLPPPAWLVAAEAVVLAWSLWLWPFRS